MVQEVEIPAVERREGSKDAPAWGGVSLSLCFTPGCLGSDLEGLRDASSLSKAYMVYTQGLDIGLMPKNHQWVLKMIAAGCGQSFYLVLIVVSAGLGQKLELDRFWEEVSMKRGIYRGSCTH